MTDALEIRARHVRPDGKISWGVYHVASDKYLVDYEDQLSAYRYAFGFLNELVAQLTEEYSNACPSRTKGTIQ